MSIHVALYHKTRYRYDRLVSLGPQTVRLRPAPHSRARILSYSLKISPPKHFINWQQDPQSNYLARLVFPEQTEEFLVEVDLVAEMAVQNPFDFFLEPDAERYPFEYDPALDHELAPFQKKCWLTPKFTKYLATIRKDVLGETKRPIKKQREVIPFERKPRTIDFLVAANRRLWKDIKYTIRLEPGVQTPEQTLEKLSGSCRDSAWLLCQLLRHYGFAARFVSGYLIQLKADVKSLDGPSGAEKDFTDLHAWAEVYLPGAGWIGFDPTSGLLAGEGHIPLACAPDPTSAAPITGLVDECECNFGHDMKVTRIYESPRVTLPYTDEQWERLLNGVGHPEWWQIEDRRERLRTCLKGIAKVFPEHDSAHWLKVIEEADCPGGPVNNYDTLFNDPEVIANESVSVYEHPVAGPVRSVNPGMRFSETPARMWRIPPRLGEHTEEILREAGIAREQIEEMRKGKVIN